MEKKVDAVKIMREIRAKLAWRYLKSHDKELKELNKKFGYLKKEKDSNGVRLKY